MNYIKIAQELAILTGHEVSSERARRVAHNIERHQRLQEHSCNRELTSSERAEDEEIEDTLRAFFGPRLGHFNGDPRGATVKLIAKPDDPAFDYFGRDWGGNLIFLGDDA